MSLVKIVGSVIGFLLIAVVGLLGISRLVEIAGTAMMREDPRVIIERERKYEAEEMEEKRLRNLMFSEFLDESSEKKKEALNLIVGDFIGFSGTFSANLDILGYTPVLIVCLEKEGLPPHFGDIRLDEAASWASYSGCDGNIEPITSLFPDIREVGH